MPKHSSKSSKSQKLAIACWLYPGPRNYRPKYVNVLYKQVREHMPLKHRFVCIYDDSAYSEGDFDSGIELMPIPASARPLLELKSLGGAAHPACFARLWHFSPESSAEFPGRVFMFDVDSIPTADMSSLVEYQSQADFISMRRPPAFGMLQHYLTGGSWILRSGVLHDVWDDFVADPVKARADASAWLLEGTSIPLTGWIGGSDQAYLSHRLVPLMEERGSITYWKDDCGILLWDHFRKQQGCVPGSLLHFNGVHKPWALDWPLTRSLYGETEYRVTRKPLKYGGVTYGAGAPFFPLRRVDALALMAMGRIEVAG